MPRGNNIITTVDELIHLIDLTRDAELVKSIFWAVDANRISITPGREDFVARHYNRNGLFLVRSAYHCQWEEKLFVFKFVYRPSILYGICRAFSRNLNS